MSVSTKVWLKQKIDRQKIASEQFKHICPHLNEREKTLI